MDGFLEQVLQRARRRSRMRQVVGMKSAMETVAVAASVTGGPSVGKSFLLSKVAALVFRGREDLPDHVEACEREDTWPVLIVDRADQFFRQPPCEDAKVVVHLLLAFTKEHAGDK